MPNLVNVSQIQQFQVNPGLSEDRGFLNWNNDTKRYEYKTLESFVDKSIVFENDKLILSGDQTNPIDSFYSANTNGVRGWTSLLSYTRLIDGQAEVLNVEGSDVVLLLRNTKYKKTNISDIASFAIAGAVRYDSSQSLNSTQKLEARINIDASNLLLGATETTAYRGDRGLLAYQHSESTNNPHEITATQTLTTAFSDINPSNVQSVLELIYSQSLPIRNNEYLKKAGDTMTGILNFSGAGITNPNYLLLNKTPILPANIEDEGHLWWNSTEKALNISLGSGTILQTGQEVIVQVCNTSGTAIPNGAVVYPSSVLNRCPVVSLASADTFEDIAIDYGLATSEIPAAGASPGIGFATWFGKARNIDTSAFNVGDVLYISPDVPGEMTNVKPEFPDYAIQLGAVFESSETEGIVFITGGEKPINTIQNFWNGTFRESFDFLVDSNGSTVTGSLTPANGHSDMTMMLSDGFSLLDTSPSATITLSPGSATVPQQNFVYIPKSTKTLAVSTIDWPASEHIKVASIALLNASRTDLDGVLKNQNWNDHIEDTTNFQGHLSHICERIRQEHAKWHAGTEASININTGNDPNDVWVSVTGGVIYQLHRQIFEAVNMQSGGDIHIVNDLLTPYKTLDNLNLQVLDANGSSLANSSFSFVIWGVMNKTGENAHIMLNLPTDSYAKNSPDLAVADAFNFSVYGMPREFQGTGFLIARATFVLQAGGTLWSLYDVEDLRGRVPNTIAGGGSGGGTSSYIALTDTNNTYIDFARHLPFVGELETGLEFKLPEFDSDIFKVNDITDITKQLAFDVSALDTLTIRTLTAPADDGRIVVDGTNETVTLNNTLFVNGDIIQNGSAWEVHLQQLYTEKDTIILREGAVAGLSAGVLAGLVAKIYDGVNDGHLAFDNAGTARVGDVGSEVPLLARVETGFLVNDNLLQWQASTWQAVDSGYTIPSLLNANNTLDTVTDNGSITSNSISVNNLTVTGGNLITLSSIVNLFDTSVTVLNIGGASTSTSIGATTGTTTIGNHLSIIGDVAANNLSGTNTGDQVSSDFNHNLLINTHNLTTDIDHNQLTNYLASEHFTQGSISILASQISDFDTEVSNNSDVAANTSWIETNESNIVLLDGTNVFTGASNTFNNNIAIGTGGTINSLNFNATFGELKVNSSSIATFSAASTLFNSNLYTFQNNSGGSTYGTLSSTGLSITNSISASNLSGTNTGDQASGDFNHSGLNELDYASAGHTGFEQFLTFSTGLTRIANTITINDSEINHNSLFNYLTTEHFLQSAISIPASQITNFDTEVGNNTSVVANTAKVSNVTTNLSEGSTTTTTVNINSSDGANATLQPASTIRAGVMSKSKFDEVIVNNAKVSNATHSGDITGSTALTIGANKVLDSHINWGTGATQVSTVDIPEQTNLYYTEARFDSAFTSKSTTNLSEGSNLYYTEARVVANSSVSANTAARHSAITVSGSYDYITLSGQNIVRNQVSYLTDISNIPSTFTPSAHTIGSHSDGSSYHNSNWDSAYSYAQIGHLPLSGGAVTGNATFINSNGLKIQDLPLGRGLFIQASPTGSYHNFYGTGTSAGYRFKNNSITLFDVGSTGLITSTNDGTSENWKEAYDRRVRDYDGISGFKSLSIGIASLTLNSSNYIGYENTGGGIYRLKSYYADNAGELGGVAAVDYALKDVSAGWETGIVLNKVGFNSASTETPASGTHFGFFATLNTSASYGGAFCMRNDRAFFQTRENTVLQGWREFYHSGNALYFENGKNIDSSNQSEWWSNLHAIETVGTHADDYMYEINFGGDGSGRGLQLATYFGAFDRLWFRRRSDNASSENGADVWQNWKQIYHSGNANLSTVDWAAKDLDIAGVATARAVIIKGANHPKILFENINASTYKGSIRYRWDSNNAFGIYANSDTTQIFGANNSGTRVFFPTQAVLVNTTTDNGTDKLQVNGNTTLSGALKVNNGLEVNGIIDTSTGYMVDGDAGAAGEVLIANGDETQEWGSFDLEAVTNAGAVTSNDIEVGGVSFTNGANINLLAAGNVVSVSETVENLIGVAGWTVSKTSTGVYEVLHDLEAATYQISITLVGSVAGFSSVSLRSGGGGTYFVVRTFNSSGSAADSNFMFFVIGNY